MSIVLQCLYVQFDNLLTLRMKICSCIPLSSAIKVQLKVNRLRFKMLKFPVPNNINRAESPPVLIPVPAYLPTPPFPCLAVGTVCCS